MSVYQNIHILGLKSNNNFIEPFIETTIRKSFTSSFLWQIVTSMNTVMTFVMFRLQTYRQENLKTLTWNTEILTKSRRCGIHLKQVRTITWSQEPQELNSRSYLQNLTQRRSRIRKQNSENKDQTRGFTLEK